MPFINIYTSAKTVNKEELLEEISVLISSLTNKSKRFVMAKINDNSKMFFDGNNPCCLVEIKSIGAIDSSKMTQPICDLIFDKIGVPPNRIYIHFEDVPASMWGWNGRTFG